MKRRRRIPIITKKISIAVIISGFVLCSLISMVGYRAFNSQFKIEYDEHIRAVAAAAKECLNPDDFDRYLATYQTDDAYENTLKILQYFVDKFGLNLIYVSSVKGPEYKDITYIYNPVTEGGKWKSFPLGYSEHYVEPDYNSRAKKVLENGEVIVRHTLTTRSGAHITAMVPVQNSSGKIIAVLGAQMPIQTFVDAGQRYMRLVLAVEIVFAIAFFLFFTFFFSTSFITPIVMVTHETDHFASYGGEPSDRLLSVKNNDEIGTLAHSVHQMEIDVCRNIQELTQVTAENERITTELNLATKIQLESLPKGYPAFPDRKDFDLSASMTPAKEVGGDLYDYLLLDDDHLMIVVGDVSGKGVPAALFMMTAKTLLASHAEQGLSPKLIFEKTNNQLCNGNETGLFVTCWLGIITLSTGELKFVNAGHPWPVLYSAQNDEFTYLKEKPNFVLGGMEGLLYTEHTVTLARGDRLFVYTDGVTEATDSEEKLFGEDRLLSAMQNTRQKNAPETLSEVRSAIDAFVGNAEQFDDITMLDFILKGQA